MNKSNIVKELIIPKEIVYTTYILDKQDLHLTTEYETYDKVIIVYNHPFDINIDGFKEELSYSFTDIYIRIFYKNTIVNNDITFVIQGLNTDITIKTILYSLPYGDVKLGLWTTDELFLVKKEIEENDIYNFDNIYYQIRSTLKGLIQCKTEYVIKVRSDEYYINFIGFINKMISENTKIITSNIFCRSLYSVYQYHMSDHIIGGKRYNILSMFHFALENIHNRRVDPNNTGAQVPPEIILCKSYILYYNNIVEQPVQIYYDMIQDFNMYDVRNFDNYYISMKRSIIDHFPGVFSKIKNKTDTKGSFTKEDGNTHIFIDKACMDDILS
jgi:hypothetical protein